MNPQVFHVSREPQCVVSKAKSFLGHARRARASGVGLCLLLDGWFVNDSFIAVTFFATGRRRAQTR